MAIDKTAEQTLQRWEDLKVEQRNWLPVWQELADYIQPRKGNIAFRRSSGQQQTGRLFDSTAPHANELLAASMQGALTSAAFRWFSLAIRNLDLDEHQDAAILLDECSEDMFQAINESAFASESHELYLDAPSFGIAGMIVEERAASKYVPAGSLLFNTLPPGSFVIDENKEGRVDTTFREFQLSARAAANFFGEMKLGAQVAAALAKNSAERFTFIQGIYPREDAGLGLGRRLPAAKKAYASIYVDVLGKKTMDIGGYDECPALVPRWTKTSGEIYGRGPGFIALPDIKTLNKAVELKLKAWGKIVDPPLMVRSEAVVGPIQLKSAGLTYVRDMDAVKPLTELGGDLKQADLEEEKIRAAIRRMFYSDQLQLQEGPQMTAYEVQVRYELMQRILGPTLGRLQVEYLNPLIHRIFWIRLRASEANSPYRQLFAWCKQNGVALDVEYEGPLAKAQRLAESTAMQRFWQIVLPLTEVAPSVIDNIDFDYMVREHAESVGTPAKMLRSQDEVKNIRSIKQQQQAKQAQEQTMLNQTKSAGQVAPLVAALGKNKEGTIPGPASPALPPMPSPA
jgi:hypothetical protein